MGMKAKWMSQSFFQENINHIRTEKLLFLLAFHWSDSHLVAETVALAERIQIWPRY